MPFLFGSCNIRMNHPQPECQGCLLMKVTLMVSILPFPFRKVTLEAGGGGGDRKDSLVSLMPEPLALVQPQEVTGASGN